MSTAEQGVATLDGSDPAAVPAAQRGRLQIPERVVQRIAAQAASEVGAAGGRSGGFLGLGSRPDLDARPRVRVILSRDAADLEIELAVDYPTSIRAAAEQVRRHVADRVQQLTGIAVHRVDIDVVAAGRAERRAEPNGGLR